MVSIVCFADPLNSYQLASLDITMKLVIYSNYLNRHQVFVADALYIRLNSEFRFVATLPRNEKELKGGADYSTRPYCILAGESREAHKTALTLALNAESCVFGANSQEYAVARAQQNSNGISFEMGERWLKHGWLTFGSPVFRKWIWNYYQHFHHANFYKLCCSSFTACDDMVLRAYGNRHFKWGYFTEVHENYVEASEDASISENKNATILWCARFLRWKHPEMAIRLAERLKLSGYKFHMNMYGDVGHLAPHDTPYPMERAKALMKELGVEDCVTLKGNRPNAEIQEAMRKADIFLFTSDRLEGWGAVANESMLNGCALVASDAIGSTRYLVNHCETGMVFESCNMDSLYLQVKYLLDNPEERKRISQAGQRYMIETWSPENAAKSLLQLIEDLKCGHETSILHGPCSKA